MREEPLTGGNAPLGATTGRLGIIAITFFFFFFFFGVACPSRFRSKDHQLLNKRDCRNILHICETLNEGPHGQVEDTVCRNVFLTLRHVQT